MEDFANAWSLRLSCIPSLFVDCKAGVLMSKGTRNVSNIAFVGTQKMQTEESFSCLCNSLMPMLRHHCPHHQPSSCFGEGGEEISSLGDIYDAATASTAAAASVAGSIMTSKSLHHPFSSTEPSFTFNPQGKVLTFLRPYIFVLHIYV